MLLVVYISLSLNAFYSVKVTNYLCLHSLISLKANIFPKRCFADSSIIVDIDHLISNPGKSLLQFAQRFMANSTICQNLFIYITSQIYSRVLRWSATLQLCSKNSFESVFFGFFENVSSCDSRFFHF